MLFLSEINLFKINFITISSHYMPFQLIISVWQGFVYVYITNQMASFDFSIITRTFKSEEVIRTRSCGCAWPSVNIDRCGKQDDQIIALPGCASFTAGYLSYMINYYQWPLQSHFVIYYCCQLFTTILATRGISPGSVFSLVLLSPPT